MSGPEEPPVVVALAGGVGGARLAHGLQAHVGERLTVVVNTADDLELHGLAIWPDHDTVLYTLAGVEDPANGWGRRDETWHAMDALGGLGGDAWFRLGDRDLATHLFRTGQLANGGRPTDAAASLGRAFAVRGTILPMTDTPVRTSVRTPDGWLPFQEYFVRLRQAPEVLEVRFDGVATARTTPEVEAAVGAAGAIVVCPSNPIVSIGPILAVGGMTDLLAEARARGTRIVAVSPIVAGRALKGPADRMLASLGHEASALGVARLYAGLVDALVVDEADAGLAGAIAAVGVEPVVAPSIMTDDAARARLAGVVLGAAGVAGP
jgi:LPPG:FO 2-phospho-L-lactate transferase